MSPEDNGARGEGEIQLDDFTNIRCLVRTWSQAAGSSTKANLFWRFVFTIVLAGLAVASFQLWRTGT